MSMRSIWRRGATQIRAEVDEELEFHLSARVAELERQGYSPEQARREAVRRLGDRSAVAQDCAASDMRREQRTRRRELLGDVRQDARIGLRQLQRRPGLAILAVLTLGVAIGATTAIYAVADHVLLRPLPYEDPAQVMTLWETDLKEGATRSEVSPANYLDWVASARSFSSMALATPFSVDLTGPEGPPQALKTWDVTEQFFDALGVRPMIGRVFSSGEYQRNSPRVALISNALWQRRFAGDATVVGRVITLDGIPTEIVGVLPPSLEYPDVRELVMPKRFTEEELTDRRSGFMHVVARLRDGVTMEQAQAEMNALALQMSSEHSAMRDRGVSVLPLREAVLGNARPAVAALMFAVSFLLLIACANLANILVARGMERSAELSVRGALGAGRGRIARQLLTESLVLAVAGGITGIIAARFGIRALLALAPADLPRMSAVSMDARVLWFALATTLVTAALFGMVPALRLSRPDLMGTLRGGSGSSQHSRLRGALVAGQVGLCVVLLTGAGLLGRSMLRLMDNELGFEMEERAVLQLFLWDNVPSDEQRVARVRELLERFERVPGVAQAGAVSSLPFHPHAITARGGLRIAGAPPVQPGDEPRVLVSVATPSYFEVMGVPLRSGRMFSDADGNGAPLVAVVSESFAREHFPDGNAVGSMVTIGVMSAPAERQVIGVVGDVRPSAFDSEPAAELFIPHAQSGTGSMTFVARATGGAATALPSLRDAVWSVDRTQSIYHTATVEGLVAITLAQRRFHLLLSGAFAGIAFGLVVVGIYGVVSLWARQRHREFGVRMALGARAGEITRLVVMHALRLALPGLLCGLAVSLLATRSIAHMLYGVRAADAPTLLQVTVLVLGAAAAAAMLAARSGTPRDPLRAIRGP